MATLILDPAITTPGATIHISGSGYDLENATLVEIIAEGGAVVARGGTLLYAPDEIDGSLEAPDTPGDYAVVVSQAEIRGRGRGRHLAPYEEVARAYLTVTESA